MGKLTVCFVGDSPYIIIGLSINMGIFIWNRAYTGPVKAVVLDWAGTAVDYGCMGPTAVFVDVFKKFGISVSIEEARKFMGLMKKDHIRRFLNCHPSVNSGKANSASCLEKKM